jgi:hypothetical protein
MPLLPRKNSLDFNPDATVAASKKLTSIALERMKNPLEDPDFATASTLAAARNLSDNFDRLEGLAGRYSSLVTRLGNLLGFGMRQREMRRQMEEAAEMLGYGRKKGGANDRPYDPRFDDYSALYPSSSSSSSSATPRPRDINPQELLRLLAAQMSERMRADADDYSSSAGSSISVGEYNRRLAADRGRFRQFYDDDSRNSTATPASSGYYPYDDPSEPSYPDDDDNSTIPTQRSFRPRIADPDPDTVGERAGANFNSLIYPLIQTTREMNSLLNSRIKPAISQLTSTQIDKMNKIYQMVRTSYNDAIFPITKKERKQGRLMRQAEDDIENAIISNNQFGDEVISVWNEERKNLLLNLTIVINSWKQNTPTGQQVQFGDDITREFQDTASRLGEKAEMIEEGYGKTIIPQPQGAGRKPRGRPKKDTMTMTMVGSGRNFYGEQINNSRDIPTIWRSYKDCPTKYLL